MQFLRFHLGRLVQQDDVAELDLLDDQILDVLFADVRLGQALAIAKLVLHAQGVHHGDDAVKPRQAIDPILRFHRRDGADGLGDGCRFTDARCLDDDVVKLLHLHQVGELLHQIHLQGAADAAVLQGHKRVVLLVHDAALLDKVGIDVHFSEVVHDDREAYALLILQNAVEQGRFSAAQISGEQQHRCFFHCLLCFSIDTSLSSLTNNYILSNFLVFIIK